MQPPEPQENKSLWFSAAALVLVCSSSRCRCTYIVRRPGRGARQARLCPPQCARLCPVHRSHQAGEPQTVPGGHGLSLHQTRFSAQRTHVLKRLVKDQETFPRKSPANSPNTSLSRVSLGQPQSISRSGTPSEVVWDPSGGPLQGRSPSGDCHRWLGPELSVGVTSVPCRHLPCLETVLPESRASNA